jgi:hypothetical protein
METLVIPNIVIPKKSEFAALPLGFEKLGLEQSWADNQKLPSLHV